MTAPYGRDSLAEAFFLLLHERRMARAPVSLRTAPLDVRDLQIGLVALRPGTIDVEVDLVASVPTPETSEDVPGR